MLSRIATIPLRFKFATNLPQVVRSQQRNIQQYQQVQNQQITSNFGEFNINFQQQIDGKHLILQTNPVPKYGINLSQFTTALCSVGAGYGIVSNFNYLLTLGFIAGGLATVLTSARRNSLKQINSINSIQIDKDNRLHINYLKQTQPYGFDTVIVDKKDFHYNVVVDSDSNAIWCKINGQTYWINKNGLQINSHQYHNLV